MDRQIQVIITAVFFSFLLFPVVTSLAFQQNTNADIKHAVRVYGGIPDSVLCNITVYYPNSTIFYPFTEMTDSGSYFNYTINASNTSLIGQYNYDVTCLSSGNLNETRSFSFWINPGGIEPTQERTDALSRTIYFVSGIALLLFTLHLFAKKLPFKYTYLILAMLMLLIVVNMVFITLQDEVVNPRLQDFFETFTVVSYYMFWFLGFLLFFLWIVTFIVSLMNSMKMKKNQRFNY